MPPESSSFTPLNIPSNSVPEWMGTFTLSAPPNSNLWRKPPARDTSTAPILYTSLSSPFVSAEVTVSANWEFEWDQAGLVIFAGGVPLAGQAAALLRSAQGNAPPAYTPPQPATKWVKVGLEYCYSACHATSVCANSEGADWSLTALPPCRAGRSDLRIKMERLGDALWVWFEDDRDGWKKLREVTWFFWGVEDKAIRVGVYASRPANLHPSIYPRGTSGGGGDREIRARRGQRELVVDFDGLEIR
ncbi:hypothetical protein K402DRAFT_332203 [Aulographum hederae CBS 113979]|uniref:DUF1349-domain-containing protein n=1 Tax=Aulographum hederae CBS 113979 TaxID=1176131 RepID=A0A6G1H0E2_9PEZI|nr:hypothetical protein K402DRAFT_332203 [Aulographum hederae CBS 113979]